MKDSLVHNVNINIRETTEIRAVESHIKVAQTVSSLSVMCNSHERVLFTIFKLYLSWQLLLRAVGQPVRTKLATSNASF